MSTGFSQTLIIGNVGNDPEPKYTASGKNVTTFSVAVNKSWNDANGQPQEKTDWFRVSAWSKLGELCAQYLSKGRQVMVVGEISASAWTGQAGDARASLELTAREVKFLGSVSGNSGGNKGVTMAAPASIEDEDIPF
jgi:single-strand DNA-binding protein